MNLLDVDHRRSIIDRRGVADRIASLRGGKKLEADVSSILREALAAGREEIARRLAAEPGRGRPAAQATAYLHDQLVRLAHGGTGRGEMAPFSDLDLMVLTATAPTAAAERAAEAILHLLWDLKLKVGHSVRSQSQLIALARKWVLVGECVE